MIGDLPSIASSAHTHSIYGMDTFGLENLQNMNSTQFIPQRMVGQAAAMPAAAPTPQPAKTKARKEERMTRRLVQVFIADPDENVPLDKSLLYSGEQKLTDATDQELFFEIDIKSILTTYNTLRVTFINKKVKERTEYLEPVKIRDLKMVVVNVASF